MRNPFSILWGMLGGSRGHLESNIDQSHVDRMKALASQQRWTEESFQEFLGGRSDPIGEPGSQYNVMEIIALGGQGAVVRGVHTMSREVVAIKFAPPNSATDRDIADRFIAEVQALQEATKKCNGVVRVLSSGQFHDVPFFVMEFVKETLGDFIRNLWPHGGVESPLRPEVVERIRRIALQLAEGLVVIHDVVRLHHGDLKPGNILFDRRENLVKIIDFGIAKHADPSGQPQQLAGTPAFMSPEQASEGEVDHRSDLFALGLILYEMCTGQRAYSGKDQATVLELARRGALPSLDALPVPDPLNRAIRGLLQIDPNKRIQSAARLLAMLRGEDNGPPPPKGEIKSPKAGAGGLRNPFPASVAASGIPSGYHLWLTVERDGGCWPKETSISPTGGERLVVHEGGPRHLAFSLCLWMVPRAGHEAIRGWFRACQASSDWPSFEPMDTFDGAVLLHRVDGLELG